MTTEYITLDVWDAENIRVKAKQREINSRFLEVQFIDKNEPLDLEDKQVFFLAKRPDGDIIFDCCEVINEGTGKINLALTSQISAVAGIMKDCEFDIIFQDLSKLKVKGLILEIERCTDFDSETESTSEFTALEEAMAGYERASDAIDAHIADKENPHEVTATQIGAAESSHTHSQYLTVETDPTVPLWAKASTKPTYSYSEISNTPTIPTTITDLTGILPISQGGTNATSASAALSNLGAVPTTRTINSKVLSSNITLNASDVGAAPYEVKYNVDFDDMKTPGLYTMVVGDNRPTGDVCHSLIVNRSYDEDDFVQQIAIKESTYEVYMRYCSNTSWSNWKKFSMDGHSHAASDITSGILPITMGGTGATTASDAVENLGAVKFSKVVQQKIYIPDQPEVAGSSFRIISLTNPFKGNTTDKILGITSYNISGRFEPNATGDRCVMYLNSPCPFDNTSSLGSIMVYNSYGRSLYVTTDSYIVVTSIKP